ncbi:hypothetical protein Rhal01_02793 [Rubritalea halochordaticola]|uniref:Sulfatase N-terminal domain-containing protein n=1 Tax=Rubritalea halochordaticola TaxID=714537 RepID=A0ABP9V1P1_9BACT
MKPSSLAFSTSMLSLIVFATTESFAASTWTNAGGNGDFYTEANWDSDPNTAGTQAPANGSIDAGSSITENLIISASSITGVSSAPILDGSSLDLLNGASLTMSNGTGIGSTTTASSPVTLDGSTMHAMFLARINLQITGSSTLTLDGPGNPVNSSTINFLTPTDATLRFTGESISNVRSEHLSKITLDGQSVTEGVDVEIIDLSGVTTVRLLNTDTDNDNLPDSWEIQYFGDLSRDGTGDFDNDNLTDSEEYNLGTRPDLTDTDGDTLEDGDEHLAGLDPNKKDTDGDLFEDNVETDTGFFLSASDTGTDPLNKDTDGDRIPDGVEYARGFNPLDSSNYPQMPNIILILADDLGYGELGSYGQQKILTPRLDQMAAQGMRFTQFYCGSAVCAPTRAMLLTGKHSGQAPIRNNGEVGNGYQTPLPAGSTTIATMLKQAGYATSCIGKWGLGGPGTTGEPKQQGFDHFFGYLGQVQAHHYYPSYQWRNDDKVILSQTLASQLGTTVDVTGANNSTGFDNLSLSLANKNNDGNVHSHDLQTKEAMDWITAHQSEPFFMYLAYPIPHVSVQAPAHIDDLTDADGIVFTNDRNGKGGRTCVDEFYPVDTNTGLRPFGAPIYHNGSGHYTYTDDKRHEYAAMISAMDRDIGRIVDLLESLNLDDNTLIIFTSDNGATFLGEVDRTYFDSMGGLRGAKGNLYEGGVREPFIAWWPGKIPAGQVSDLVGHHDDLMATFAEATGTTHAPDTTGRSILPTLLGNSADQISRDTFYWEFSNSSNWTRTLRKGDWKLHRVTNKSTGARSYELYDLSTDITESNNVVNANPSIKDELERLMDAEHSPAPISTFFRPTDEFQTHSGVTVSFDTLGFSLSGTGQVITPLTEDISGPASFDLTTSRGGGFAFGSGDNFANMIQVSTASNLFTLSYNGQSTSATYPSGDPSTVSIKLTWNPETSTVTADFNGTQLQLVLSTPPALIDYISYSVNGGSSSFNSATVSLPLPAFDLTQLTPQISGDQLMLHYHRNQSGSYIYEFSDTLASDSWTTLSPLREQPVNLFGNQQSVMSSFIIREDKPKRFYRVRYVTP